MYKDRHLVARRTFCRPNTRNAANGTVFIVRSEVGDLEARRLTGCLYHVSERARVLLQVHDAHTVTIGQHQATLSLEACKDVPQDQCGVYEEESDLRRW